MSSDHTGKCVYWHDSSDCPHPMHIRNVTVPKECKRCLAGDIPEWSIHAKCYIHRDKRLDRTCDNPKLKPQTGAHQ